MDNSFDQVSLETIDLLGARLARIEYAVRGHNQNSNQDIYDNEDDELHEDDESTVMDVGLECRTIRRGLADVERALHTLASKSQVVQDLLWLHARYPDLFSSLSADQVPSTLDTSSVLSIVLASASSFPTTASRLNSILDVPIPPPQLSAHLISLQPRIARAGTVQVGQEAELAALRSRTAAVLHRWYKVDILSAGEAWADVERRVEKVDRRVKRAETQKEE